MKWTKEDMQATVVAIQDMKPMVAHIAKAMNLPYDEALAQIVDNYQQNVNRYTSDSGYHVTVFDVPANEGWPEMVHLSISNRDLSALLDWRHLQEIKNDLVGEENEAVQLFPAESRLVDQANQFHLWALKDPTINFPFGFQERLVEGRKTAAEGGAVQRALPKKNKAREETN